MPNVPKLRFPEFSGEWIEKSIKNLFSFVKSYSYSRKNLIMEEKEKNILYLHYGDIHKKYKQHLDLCKVSLPQLKQNLLYDEKDLLKDGDLIITDASEDYEGVGESVEIVNICNKKMLAGLHTIVLRPKINGKGFYGYLFYIPSVKKKLKKIVTGISVLGLSKNELVKLKILIPPTLAEQQKIASFLSSVDEKIELQEQKIEQLEKYKKALLQKLFATKDKKVSELRFPEFSGEWVEKRLGELIEECAARNKNKQIENILSISNKQGFVSQIDFFDKRVASKDISNYKIVKKGWFAYNPARINVGSIALLRKFSEGIISPMYIVFKTKSNLNNIFLNYWLKTYYFNEQLKKYLVGSVRQSLNIKDLKLMKILIPPTLTEQEKIASFLSAIDTKFELEKEKLEKIKEYKEALLQKMFV